MDEEESPTEKGMDINVVEEPRISKKVQPTGGKIRRQYTNFLAQKN